MKTLYAAALAALPFVLDPSASLAQTTLRVAHALSPSEPIHQAMLDFAEAVEERSDGELVIQVFPSEQLGANVDIFEQVLQGAPIIEVADAAFMADYVSEFGVLNGPYLLNDPRDFTKILQSDWYAQLQDKARERGFEPLAFNYFFGERHVLGNEGYPEPEDIAGVTMRIAPNPIWIETFKALDVRATPLPWTEVYSALAQNVVEAVEAPLGSLLGSKLQEQRKVLTMTSHFTQFLGLVMNHDLFEGLSPELQTILREEAEKAGEAMTAVTLENNEKLLADLEADGVEVVRDVDIEAYREKTSSVYSQFPEWEDGLYEKMQGILGYD